jgi:apolipoprotein N-acyltransferase
MADQATSVQERVKEKATSAQPEPERSPAPVAGRASGAPRPHLALPALASAGLLWLCYFPVAWGWLGWVALVPLLTLVRAEASPRRIKLCAWLAGLAFFWPILSWMRVADYRMYYTWAMLATYCSLYFPVAIVLLRRLDRGTNLPLVVTVPAVWVGLEFIRSWLLTGFAWYYLGHTQHDFLAIIQVTDLGGVYLVSLLVAAVNAWLFEVLYAWRPFRDLLRLPGGKKPPAFLGTSRRRLVIQGAVVGALLVAALQYGSYRLGEKAFEPGPRLALLQGSLDQRIRNVDLAADNDAGRAAKAAIFDHYGELQLFARTELLPLHLIVWPETSFPEVWYDVAPGVSLDRVLDWRDKARRASQIMRDYATGNFKIRHPITNEVIKPPPANFLLGLNTEVLVKPDGRPHKYSSALLLHANGARGERYDKIHRVPFGEYVPFREWLPWMDTFAPYETDYSITPGEHLTRLTLYRQDDRGDFVTNPEGKPLVAYRFGVLICFEDTDPFLARPYGLQTEDGPPVDFLVNIANDGWFDGSSEHDEHLAISRFRAIECRRSMARAVNMGISAVIDGNGRVLRPTLRTNRASPVWEVPFMGDRATDLPVSEWADYKKVWGVLVANIPIDRRTSLYSLWGDWLPYTCWAVVGVGLVWAMVRRRRRAAHVAAEGAA